MSAVLESVEYPYKVYVYKTYKGDVVIVAENEIQAVKLCQEYINKLKIIGVVYPDCLIEVDRSKIGAKIL